MRTRSVLITMGSLLAVASCFDSGLRWDEAPTVTPPVDLCTLGTMNCSSDEELQRCTEGPAGLTWVTTARCADEGLVCAAALLACAVCDPGVGSCDGQVASVCRPDGSQEDVIETCDTTVGEACRSGSCVALCALATERRSNVGCEYWAVDLDNARINQTSNAAAQQFAVVVSSAQPDVPTTVRIFQDDGAPGDEPAPYEVATAVIAPLNLQVFKLGPREVDGSPEGGFNNGTHTALTRHAFKIVADFPVVAYQFNPLENANVFSNDATLLKPREALTYETRPGEPEPAYVVAGWPQTIAITDNPDTNFSSSYPINLRSFLTIVGTREATTVRVQTNAPIGAGGPIRETAVGGYVEATIGAFDVLNLETPDFNSFGADFTGSIISADGPIAVFSGSEAADAPHFDKLSQRRCCADHIEDQLDPLRTMGKRFAIAHTPSRTTAVKNAGGIKSVEEPDFVRFIAASTNGAIIKTTLPAPDDEIFLAYMGDFYEVTAYRDFMAESSEPISVSQVMASQDAAGVPRSLPGGDPSLLIEPPIEQFRADYVFLTPDKYAFDFISIVAPPEASIVLDGQLLDAQICLVTPTDGLDEDERGNPFSPFVTYTCQLSFPTIDPLKTSPDNVSAGEQNDGVHRLVASQPVGVVVSGFDSYVSYAYAAGTELNDISSIPQ